MSEAADTLDGDHVARARGRIAQRVVHGHARTYERPRFFGLEFIRNRRQRRGRRDHVLGVTTVEIDPSDFALSAHREIAAPTLVAHKIVSAMPADSDRKSTRLNSSH